MSDVTINLPVTDDIVDLARRRVEADIAKLKEEREKIRAERVAHSQIFRQLEADADLAQLRVEQAQFEDKLEHARDFYHHVYRFGVANIDKSTSTIVDERSVEACINTLSAWHRLDRAAPFEIIFNSGGGYAIPGMELYDYIQEMRRAGHYVITATRGRASSMAGILLQAGDKRIAGRESYVLIHEPQMIVQGKISEIEDMTAYMKKMQGRIISLFVERSRQAFEVGTSEIVLTREMLEHGDPERDIPGFSRREWWLDSAECLKYGIVDEVR